MRIGKPLLITTTALGLPIGIYEAFHLAGGLGFLVLALVLLFGAGAAWIVSIVREEARAAATPPDAGEAERLPARSKP